MPEAPAAGQPSETIPNDLIIAELEGALHRVTMENVILRARIAARDRQAATPLPHVAPEQTEEAKS